MNIMLIILCVVGALVYLLGNRRADGAEVGELGRLTFFAALLVLLFQNAR